MNAVEVNTAIITASPVALTAYAAPRATNRLSPASCADQVEHPALPVADQPVGAFRQVGGRPAAAPARAARRRPGAPATPAYACSAASAATPRSSVTSCDSSADLQVAAGRRPAGDRRDEPVAQPPDPGLQRAQELAGADELLPAGQHLAAQQPAVLQAVARPSAARVAVAPRVPARPAPAPPRPARRRRRRARRPPGRARRARRRGSAGPPPRGRWRPPASCANQSRSGAMTSLGQQALAVQRRSRAARTAAPRPRSLRGEHLAAGARRPRRPPPVGTRSSTSAITVPRSRAVRSSSHGTASA